MFSMATVYIMHTLSLDQNTSMKTYPRSLLANQDPQDMQISMGRTLNRLRSCKLRVYFLYEFSHNRRVYSKHTHTQHVHCTFNNTF